MVEALIFTPVVALHSNRTLRKLRLARDALDRLAHTDPLTGLLNRRGFDQEVQRATGALGRPAAALMCDLDEFKTINDRFGHEFGDAALRHAADVLRERKKVILGRQGGEEFFRLSAWATFLEVKPSPSPTFSARPSPAARSSWTAPRATLTMSVGLATTAAFDGRLSDLIGRADEALYEAKRKGRNRLAIAGDSRLRIVETPARRSDC